MTPKKKKKIHEPKNICNGILCRQKPEDQRNPGEEPHSCPYAEEINDDHDPEYCNCCEECQQECHWEI